MYYTEYSKIFVSAIVLKIFAALFVVLLNISLYFETFIKKNSKQESCNDSSFFIIILKN